MLASDTKYILLVGDGMGDYPLPELNGMTPLEAARTPHMDRLAGIRIGLARTIPAGAEPGSDVANLSLLGYDPLRYRTRRGPFEAVSMGVKLKHQEVAFRMNLVTLDLRDEDAILMVSHSSGDLSTSEGHSLVAALQEALVAPGIHMHPGVGYRHLLVWNRGPAAAEAIPPHDVLGRNMAPYLSSDNPLAQMIRRSWPILRDHPVNRARRANGRAAANSIWLWGQGRAPRLPSFSDRFGLQGGVISAVDLIKGIGIYAGFEPIHVEGATGYLDTNYRGKATEALAALRRLDFMFVHVEAPDEAGHSGNAAEKIQAIEAFDEKVVGIVLSGLQEFTDFRILVASDHLTPIPEKTHTAEPTPFAWASKSELAAAAAGGVFSENSAQLSGIHMDPGYELMPAFLADA